MTINAKLNVLEQILDTAATSAPQACSAMPTRRLPETPARLAQNPRSKTLLAPTESLWRVTMAETRAAAVEQALTWSLMATGGVALAGMVYTTAQFLLVEQGLFTWVRAAML